MRHLQLVLLTLCQSQVFPSSSPPLRCSTTRVFYRVMGMWCRPLFSWIEGRAGGCCLPRKAGEVVLPWEPAVPWGGKISLIPALLALWLLVTSPQSSVIAESGVICFVMNSLKFILRSSCKLGPFVLSVILGLSYLVFILERIFESFFWFSCCLWECWGSFLFRLKCRKNSSFLLPPPHQTSRILS